jgi:hypothetical protein
MKLISFLDLTPPEMAGIAVGVGLGGILILIG